MNDEKDVLQEEAGILEAYKQLQASTVSKEQYEKEMALLKEKNAMYLKAITEGSKVNTSETIDSVKLEDSVADMSKFKGTNLEYWQKMTPIIDKTLETVPDDVLESMISQEGIDELIKVNTVMKQLVEKADGSAGYFRTLYDGRVAESSNKISSEIDRSGNLVKYLMDTQNKK